MALHEQVIAEVEASPSGPQVAALFDFDGTIISGYSAVAFIRGQVKRGDLSPREFLELVAAMTSFGMGNMGFSAMMVATSQFLRGISEESYREFAEQLYQEQIARLVYPESRALVRAHQRKGHTVAIISSATPYQVLPAARDLDIENVLCTQLEVEDGEFTGGVIRPTCFGPGKVRAAEALAEQYGADLEQSFFYSDSHDDIELLERVGFPRPLNPNSRLSRVAEQRQWPIQRFSSRGRPRAADYIRSAAATLSLIPSAAAGLPIFGLTGSRRQAQNFSLSLFADVASALVGMELEVSGEEHLWSHRPSVFVFNHQSKADVIIMARLLRRDIAGVGKQEIRKMPLIGQILEFGGVVMIDRKNAASAIEAMKPLVDVMRVEGKSVALSPEGTRTVSPKLAPFKKGAFHLAMQAGVPMVPIVIHNALDVAPKGDFVFRSATVKVDVLPPVDTSDWRVETIDRHVADVRLLFEAALGQQAEESSTAKAGAKAKATPKQKGKTKAKAKPKPRAKVKTKAKAKTKAKRKTNAKAKPKLKSKAKSKAKARPKAQAKAKAKSGTRSRSAAGRAPGGR